MDDLDSDALIKTVCETDVLKTLPAQQFPISQNFRVWKPGLILNHWVQKVMA